MKLLENKTTTLPKEMIKARTPAEKDEIIFNTYGDLLIICVQAPSSPQGFTINEITERQRVVNCAKAATKQGILLEDEDYKTALNCVQSKRWPTVDQQLIDFVNAVEACQDAPLPAADPEPAEAPAVEETAA